MKTINLTACYLFAAGAGFFLAAVPVTLLRLPMFLALTGAFLSVLKLYADTSNAKVPWYDYALYAFATLAMLCAVYVIYLTP